MDLDHSIIKKMSCNFGNNNSIYINNEHLLSQSMKKQNSLNKPKPIIRRITSPVLPRISEMAIQNLSNSRNEFFRREDYLNQSKEISGFFLKRQFEQSLSFDRDNLKNNLTFMKNLTRDKDNF
jgi:hypothetical protein